MAHIVRNEPWGVTDLDLAKGHVFVRQDWRYHWVVDPETTTWTHDERFHFYNAVDHMTNLLEPWPESRCGSVPVGNFRGP